MDVWLNVLGEVVKSPDSIQAETCRRHTSSAPSLWSKAAPFWFSSTKVTQSEEGGLGSYEKTCSRTEKHMLRGFLTAWWLRVCPLLQGAQGSILVWTKILHVVYGKKKKERKNSMFRVPVCKQSPWLSHEGRREKELESGWPDRTCVSMVQTNDVEGSDMKGIIKSPWWVCALEPGSVLSTFPGLSFLPTQPLLCLSAYHHHFRNEEREAQRQWPDEYVLPHDMWISGK